MGLKKCIGLLLAVLVLSSNTGLAFSVHYCGGAIASVKPVFVSSENSCCAKPEAKPMGCCKTKIVKTEKEHETIVKSLSFAFEAPFVPFERLETPLQRCGVPSEKPSSAYYCEANAPPLFKLYSQYIFYA